MEKPCKYGGFVLFCFVNCSFCFIVVSSFKMPPDFLTALYINRKL